MSDLFYLAYVAGSRVRRSAISSSAGLADAYKIVATGEDGKIHASFLPAYGGGGGSVAWADIQDKPTFGTASGANSTDFAPSNLTSDGVAEGATNKYFSSTRVLDTLLSGISFAQNAAISASDSIVLAFGKLQAQVSGKQDTLVSGTNIKTLNGQSLLGSGNLAVSGGGGGGDMLAATYDPNGDGKIAPEQISGLATVATSGSYNDLANKPTLGAAAVLATNVAGGAVVLDGSTKIPTAYLPGHVEEVLEYANFAALPGTGVASVLYVTLDNNKAYRWGGSAYAEISASPGSTDAVPEGAANLYFTNARASAAAPVQSVADLVGTPSAAQVRTALGISNVDNTADMDKPVSTAAQTALSGKQATLVSGTNIKTVNGQSLLGSGDISISGGGSAVTLSGSTSVEANSVISYTITNYSTFSTYSATVSAGSVSITGDQISFTAPDTVQSVTLNVTVDGIVSAFNITVLPSSYIPTPTATPSNFGDALEGGFYAGLYWDQIAQSSSSKTLATGTQAFTVPDMTGNGISYVGQSLEVRSRSNPANKFIGTVSSASGTTLTLNVSSIGGSGTFSDWSVMSRFRAIVAPKSSGVTSLAIKNANTALPAGCQSLVDGLTATNAMKNADTSTVYPAAHWARGLTIGGKTDWHIPARDVLELAWRNLKPDTTSNHMAARPTSPFNYKIDGAYGDVSTSQGVNNNSYFAGAAYTSGVPAQTAATAFRTGGAEAVVSGAYLSSTEYTAAENWAQYWHPSYPGYQTTIAKSAVWYLRAFRRSII
ncbi:MAG: hypothetical protein IPO08_23475 [Xanthomonadales bacterium]|nr:hypothetical protein [Xanthomonadales bacterium]